MKRLFIALALALSSLASLTVSGEASSTYFPTPRQVQGFDYATFHRQSNLLVVAKPYIFPSVCPKLGGFGYINGHPCDPFSVTIRYWRQRLYSNGYVVIQGHRWYWVDLGINLWGGHDFGWVYGSDVWRVRR